MTNQENQGNSETVGNNVKLSFGLYLRKARLESGLSIDDVLNHTRISKYVLQQIEEENLNNLPEDVFLKGFLKAFAEIVGVEPDDVLDRYKEFRSSKAEPSDKGGEEETQNSGVSGKLIFGGILVALVVLFLLVFFFSLNNEPLSSETTQKREVNLAALDVQTSADDMGRADKKINDELQLEVVCVENTNLKISSDGGVPTEYKLKPEDHLELKADKQYNILVDNTCGVTLFLNNEPVVIPGKCGQTVNIQLP